MLPYSLSIKSDSRVQLLRPNHAFINVHFSSYCLLFGKEFHPSSTFSWKGGGGLERHRTLCSSKHVLLRYFSMGMICRQILYLSSYAPTFDSPFPCPWGPLSTVFLPIRCIIPTGSGRFPRMIGSTGMKIETNLSFENRYLQNLLTLKLHFISRETSQNDSQEPKTHAHVQQDRTKRFRIEWWLF